MAKSTRPMTRIHDIKTNEVIDREMNDIEFAQYQEQLAKHQLEVAEAEAKAQAKSVLLQKLGITEDEAKLLLS